MGTGLRKCSFSRPDLRVTSAYVDAMEARCDRFGDPLPPLRSFVLPGGSVAAAA